MSEHLDYDYLMSMGPRHGKFRNGPREVQKQGLQAIADAAQNCVTIEGPPGLGKSWLEATVALATAERLQGQVFWITPTKALVQQFADDFPMVTVALGRSDHPCLFAAIDFASERARSVTKEEVCTLSTTPDSVRADEVATLICKECPFYVDPDTGKTLKRDVVSCPYYRQRFEVADAKVVLCTMAFAVYQIMLGGRQIKGLVIDEAHRLAQVIRYTLSYNVSDLHLQDSITLLEKIGVDSEVVVLKKFLRSLRRIAVGRSRQANTEQLLDDDEVRRLVNILEPVDTEGLMRKIREAVRRREIDPRRDRVTLKQLEVLVRDLRRYTKSFMFSLPDGERRPYNFTCSYYRKVTSSNRGQDSRRRRVDRKLVVHCYHVSPLVKKRLLAPLTVAMSATIGDASMFGFETGIRYPVVRLPSTFPVKNRRIYMPTDTPDLAFKARGSKRNKTRMLRKIARVSVAQAQKGKRSLVVLVSEAERQKFLQLAEEEGLDIVSYGDGLAAKDALRRFRGGDGDALVGVSAHYSEGVDLPRQMAPFIFFLRPGFPNPNSPQELFKQRRFGRSQTIAVNSWQVMLQVVQTLGRNVRGRNDRGVVLFVDSRFRKLVFPALPEWLRSAYQGKLKWNECMDDALRLLG